MESHTATRSVNISLEGMALSDGDNVFKVLPTTAILFGSKYIEENRIDIAKLARKIVKEQAPLLEHGIYFYTEPAKTQYLAWAEQNVRLWTGIELALSDPDVAELIQIAQKNGSI